MRVVMRYLILVGFFFMLGFMYEYHLPKFETWLIVKIEDYSSKNLPLRIFPSSVKVTAWPIGLRVENIRALPKGPLAKNLAPIKVSSFQLRLRPQSLLTGDFKLSEIVIIKPEITLIATADQAPPIEKTPPSLNLQELLSIPLQKVSIEEGTLQIKSDDAGFLVRMDQFNLSAENRNESIFLDIDAPKVFIKKLKQAGDATAISIDGAVLMAERELLIRGIKINEGKSFVIASGSLKGNIETQRFTDISLKTRAHIEIAKALETLKTLYKKLELPDIRGKLDTEIIYSKSDTSPESISAAIETESLQVNKFKIGSILGKLEYVADTIQMKDLKIRNPAGQIQISNAALNLKDDMRFKGRLSLNDLELRQFLIQLSVGETPLHLLLTGALPCDGQIKPEFTINCEGKIYGHDFWVKNSSGKNIIAIDSLALDGQVGVNMKAVTAQAKLEVGKSQGEAHGVIDYQNGFDIKYSTPQLDFKDIKDLANLKIEGRGAIQGNVAGNGKAAKFNLKLKGQDIWFEDYWLGRVTSEIAYQSGMLNFKNVEGMLNATQYFANIGVDLLKDRIKVDGRLGFAEARDIQNAFSRRVQLPFEIFGNATAKLTVEGPFEFNQLTYDLDASMFRGSVGTEFFDEAKFHVISNKGHVKSHNIYLRKGSGVATMSGEGHPSGQIDTKITGRGFRLEDISTLNQTDSAVVGNINFDMTMKGYVLTPDTEIKGTITETQLGRELVPNSNFVFNLTRNQFSGEAGFLDNKVWIDFAYPFDLNTPFRFKAKTNSWNFAPLFSLISKDVSVREFDTAITADIDLQAKTGGFWNSTGRIQIPTFRIRRGNLELYNPQTPTVLFDNGKMDIKNFLLQGDNTFLKVEAENSTKNDFNMSLNGKIEMSLLAFLTPFFSDLRGILSIAGQLDGSAEQPKMIGSAFIEKGYAKLKEFVHPFENIKADFLFNQQRIVVNSIQSTFAGGEAFADGSIEIKGLRKFITDIRGRFDRVNLHVPKDFNTQGSGDFRITGEWFPYLLSGTYRITGGTITKAFGDDAQTTAQIKRSSLLPGFLLERGFSPLKFDLQTYFPSELNVKNNLITTEVRGQLKIMGTPDDPILLGEITTPAGGTLMFRDVPFEIQSANMKFTNPTKINPSLYASAAARIQDYDINLLLQGTRENYQIVLRSTPPLPEQDIISLLALGYTPKQLEAVKSDEQIDQQSYEIGGAILSNNPLGNEIKSKYGISVRFGSAVDDTTKTVAPRVIVEKQWSPKFGTSASRTVGNVVTQDVKAEYKLNKNVSLIGSWEGKEYTEENKASEIENKNTDVLGLDLQYRQEFK